MPVVSVKQAALLMEVSDKTIRRLIKKGELKAFRVGRQYRLPLDQFSESVDVEAVRQEVRRRGKAADRKTEPTNGATRKLQDLLA